MKNFYSFLGPKYMLFGDINQRIVLEIASGNASEHVLEKIASEFASELDSENASEHASAEGRSSTSEEHRCSKEVFRSEIKMPSRYRATPPTPHSCSEIWNNSRALWILKIIYMITQSDCSTKTWACFLQHLCL